MLEILLDFKTCKQCVLGAAGSSMMHHFIMLPAGELGSPTLMWEDDSVEQHWNKPAPVTFVCPAKRMAVYGGGSLHTSRMPPPANCEFLLQQLSRIQNPKN